MKKLTPLFLLLLTTLFFTACGGDDVDCTGTSFNAELSAEINALSSAATAYALDPENPDSCNAYKDALKSYLDALKPYESCATNAQEEAEFRAALDDAQDDIDQLQC